LKLRVLFSALGSHEEGDVVVLLGHDFTVAADVSVVVVELGVPAVNAAGFDERRVRLSFCWVVFWAAAAAGIIWNWWWLGSTVLFVSAAKTVNKALRCFFKDLDVLFVDFEFSNNTELGNDVDDVILDVLLGHLIFDSKWELDCEFNNDGSRCVDFSSLFRFPFFVGVEWSNIDVGDLGGLDSDVFNELAETSLNENIRAITSLLGSFFSWFVGDFVDDNLDVESFDGFAVCASRSISRPSRIVVIGIVSTDR